MRYDLRQMALRLRKAPPRGKILFRDIAAPGTLATDLYRSGYSDVIAIWTAAADRIAAEYERSLSPLVTDAPSDVQSEIDRAEDELSRLFLTLRPRLTSWAWRVEKWYRGKWRGAVLSATKVDIATLIGPEDVRETLGAFVERNVGLVRNVSDQVRARIGESVFRGMTERRPARDVAKEIRESVGMARDRSVRIASDQLTKTTAALASERRREAGLDSWAWVASHKLHFRPEHQARDGKVYTDTNPPPTLPGQEINCGCRGRAVMNWD